MLGGMRLLVNSGHESIPDMLRSGSSDPRAAVLRSFVTFDVARSLIAGPFGTTDLWMTRKALKTARSAA